MLQVPKALIDFAASAVRARLVKSEAAEND